VTKKPFRQCTEPIATTITEVIASAASGVTTPSAKSRPAASHDPATSAMASGGRNPSAPKKPAVPRGPWPPNQPKSFWAPCAKSVVPATTRRTRMP